MASPLTEEPVIELCSMCNVPARTAPPYTTDADWARQSVIVTDCRYRTPVLAVMQPPDTLAPVVTMPACASVRLLILSVPPPADLEKIRVRAPAGLAGIELMVIV